MSCPFTGSSTSSQSKENVSPPGQEKSKIDISSSSEKEEKQCPLTGGTSVDIEEIDENPSVTEYKKLKRIMGIVTQFYRDGTDFKMGHYTHANEQINKIDLDIKMLEEQKEVLATTEEFAGHPKQKEYLNDLRAEKEHLESQREMFTAKQQEYLELAEWSKGIVRVCEWLELNLDDYCSKTLDYPKLKNVVPAPQLSAEDAETYSRGLDEITHNLKESQDFFLASVDGRLHKYHTLEKKIIESQLEVVRKYPEDNERRKTIEPELQQDLDFVLGNMTGPASDMKRREKMLNSHSEFFKVLKYHKEKLKVLYIDTAEQKPREYDTRFDHFKE